MATYMEDIANIVTVTKNYQQSDQQSSQSYSSSEFLD